jgi:hypothetical protein
MSTQDDKQAHDQKISAKAEWIWAGQSSEDFKTIDSAYCRIEVNCSQHECKEPIATADDPGVCPGPGPHGAPGYSFQEDPSVTYEVPWSDPSLVKSMAVPYEEKQLGKVVCGQGYAMAQPQVESTCGLTGDGEKVWKFEGCCADFLWSIPATNYLVAAMAFVLMSYMFIAFHIICDDFFVPALNVMCETVGLSDDVSTAARIPRSHHVLASSVRSLRTFVVRLVLQIAGATFMAAGASSPELFASLVGVLTNSAVGVGTVVGSELFNMLVIIGGVCLVTPKALQLDWRPLSREVFFFSLSLVLVLWVLNDEQVETKEASVLLGGYAAYVVVCATFKPLVRIFCPVSGVEGADNADYYVDFYADENVNIADEDLTALSDTSGGIIGTPTAAAMKASQSSAGGSISGGASLSEGLLQQGDALPGAGVQFVTAITAITAMLRRPVHVLIRG